MQWFLVYQLSVVKEKFINKQLFQNCRKGKKIMVKLEFDLSESEIELLSYCMESAIDTKLMTEQEKQTAKRILNELSKFL